MKPAELQARLEADLLGARRGRRGAVVAAIASLKTALANAEAVPVEERPFALVEGSADVPRRELGPDEVATLVEREVEERRRAIITYRAAGHDVADLELELATLERYRDGR